MAPKRGGLPLSRGSVEMIGPQVTNAGVSEVDFIFHASP